MLNLDWFQPYEGTVYSTGVIYAAICNLPRDIRFKRENILILGILPGPNEVSLHQINHYLAPIVDELLSLWTGIIINHTFEYQNGRNIRAALILVSCDIPAARKVCGHISALVSCHRCEKKSNYENGQHNFAGIIDDMNEGLEDRNSVQHREDAIGWRRCNSKAARDRFVQQTSVRWSELLRLPYFDPIRFIIVDPMHCLFLGIAKWIVKRIWIDEGILTPNVLKEIQKKMNQFQVPSDLGRISRKVDCGEGFSHFTADQWRNFFTIYATVALWDHLPEKDRKILSQFVRICSIFVCRIVNVDSIREANRRLIEIVKLIEENYGRNKITPNLHLSLHLHECSSDYGPLYAFWCFSFERMNGIIGKA
jgi:Transposase family tnp2